MVLGIYVHGAHAVNTVSTILKEVTGQEVTLLFHGLYQWRVRWDCCGLLTGCICLRPLHGATCKSEGVIIHMRGVESFSGQVLDPVTELVVTHCDKANPLTVKGMADRKSGIAAIAVVTEFWGI